MGSEAKLLSLHEVSKPITRMIIGLLFQGRCTILHHFWMIIQGSDEVLLLATKKDATEDFEDVGHSQNARNMLGDYYVGDIVINSMPQKGKQPPTGVSGSQQAASSGGAQYSCLFYPY
ncbi:putative cytochrome b5-like heme/steroid binding domain-containing protein [Helianthus debilis subsp. tardiflorus]